MMMMVIPTKKSHNLVYPVATSLGKMMYKPTMQNKQKGTYLHTYHTCIIIIFIDMSSSSSLFFQKKKSYRSRFKFTFFQSIY